MFLSLYMADKKTPQEASNIFHSIIKASVSNPKTEIKTYSQKDADEIRSILLKLRTLSSDEQKGVRADLRKRLDFHIEDYTTSKAGFTADDFDSLIKKAQIRIK